MYGIGLQPRLNRSSPAPAHGLPTLSERNTAAFHEVRIW